MLHRYEQSFKLEIFRKACAGCSGYYREQKLTQLLRLIELKHFDSFSYKFDYYSLQICW